MEVYLNELSRYRGLFINIDVEQNEYFNFSNDINLEANEPFFYTNKKASYLFRIAGYMYFNYAFSGNQLWWAIAELNNIIDPLEKIKARKELLIPQLNSIKYLERKNLLFGVV